MTEFYQILDIYYSLIKANFLIAAIVIILYIIEINTKLILFVKQFKWKKSLKNAKIHRDRDQGSYFIFCCLVYLFDLFKGNIRFTIISFIFWIISLVFLATLFGKIYDRYQGIDPNKADDDYTL